MTALLCNEINVVLIADKACRANLLHDVMQETGISGIIRRIKPGDHAIECAKQTGTYRNKPLPDLFFYDFTDPDKHEITVLREIAFGQGKAGVPVILLTSPKSQEMLDAGDIDGGQAVMFTPTELSSFVGKMRNGGRKSFFKALRTLYQLGPILVRTPEEFLRKKGPKKAIPARTCQ